MCKQAIGFKTISISVLDPELMWYSPSPVLTACVLCKQESRPTTEGVSHARDNFTVRDAQWGHDYLLLSGFPRSQDLCDHAEGECRCLSVPLLPLNHCIGFQSSSCLKLSWWKDVWAFQRGKPILAKQAVLSQSFNLVRYNDMILSLSSHWLLQLSSCSFSLIWKYIHWGWERERGK